MSRSGWKALRALDHPNYRIWAAGAFVSNIGTWVQRVAQDWLVLTELTHHDAAAVGWVMACQFAPQLLWLPWSGLAADYFDQRRLLLLTQAAMGALSLLLALLTLSGQIRLWQVDVFAFLFGSAAALDAPVRQTFVVELVRDQDLHNAVALNSTSFNAARLIGPAVSGMIIAAMGTGWAFLLNGLSFLAVLLSLVCLRRTELRGSPRAPRRAGSFVEGLRYVWHRQDLRTTLLMLFLIGTFGLNFPIFLSTMAVSVFHTSAYGFGLLSTIMAIGSIGGAVLNAQRERPRFRNLQTGAALFGLGCALAALAPTYWSFALTLVLIGVAAMTFTNTSNSLMQLSTEPSMRGRVMALRAGVALGGTPLGAPIVGWVASHWGPRWGLGIGALSGAAAAGVAWLHRPEPERGQDTGP
ncbi:MFS transporter [Frateuria aurantia]